MVDKTKVLYLTNTLKKLPDKEDDDDDQSIYIEGYASTNSPDRVGDVIPASVWEKGLKNYLKNPIILAHHKHSDPAGRMVEHKVDEMGLWIKARISAGASIYKLVKDEVMTAFSVGIRILDAEYNAAAELFIVKELELMEVSVVSVPCNQDTLFSLSKSFDSESEYNEFKSLFTQGASAKGHDNPTVEQTNSRKEFTIMDKELQEQMARVAAEAAEKALNARLAAEKAVADAAAAEAARKEEIRKAAIEAAKGIVETGQTGAERLVADLTKKLEEDKASMSKVIDDLRSEISAKAEEMAALHKSKMNFADKGSKDEVSYEDKEKAVLLSTISRKSLADTKFGKQLLEKALGAGAAVGAHLPSQTWEHEVSLNMENEIRRRLVVAPLFRAIDMKTNVMSFPLNPEAGIATWITNAQFGTTASPGAAQTHQLKEVTLNAYKVSTMEYLTFEEEEDSLLALLPIIRDAMVRRVSRAMDKAYLLGAGGGADPVKGAALYDATSVVVPTNTGAASIANLRALRKDLGAWGLSPEELVYVVSTDIYYDLLDDTTFQTMDKVGDKATLLRGQIGVIGNTPVLVSDQFPTKAGGAATASTNIGAICVAPGNFLAGNQRGLRFDTQDLVETQRRVLVASLRTGMTQITTNLGQGVSTLRWS